MGMNLANAISLRHVRAFTAVARYSSFTRASDQIHLSQPALTACIQQLEDIVGTALFERTTRSVNLTAAGQEFLPTAERLIGNFDSAIEGMQAIVQGRHGRLSIAATPSVAAGFLPLALAALARERPDLCLQLESEKSSDVRQRVARGQVELGLASVPSASDELTCMPLIEDRIGLVCSADHPLARQREPLRWVTLTRHALLDMGHQGQIRTVVAQIPELARCFSGASYRISNPAALAAVIEATGGLTILPEMTVPHEYRERIAFVPLADPAVTRSISVITRRGQPLSPPARAMLRILQSCADADEDGLWLPATTHKAPSPGRDRPALAACG